MLHPVQNKNRVETLRVKSLPVEMYRLHEGENVKMEMCRLCFTLALSQQTVTKSPFAQEFNNFMFIEVQIGFKLPANVCGQCLLQLNQLGSFLKMCKDAFHTYKQMKLNPQTSVPNLELTSDIGGIKQEASESEENLGTSIDIVGESEKLFAKFSQEDPFFETITLPQTTKAELDCDDTFSDPFYYEDTNMEEMNKKTSSQIRMCPTCGVNVTTLTSHYCENPKCGPQNSNCHRLLHHQKTHHSEQVSTSLMCHICLKAFQYADSLSQHLQTHENDQQDGCDQSGNGTPNSDSLPSDTEEASTSVVSLPGKSRIKYEQAYKRFVQWCNQKGVKNETSEKVLLAYFENLAKLYKASSLWAYYSMLRATLSIKKNIDISKCSQLVAFLKRQAKGYKPKKSKVFSKNEITRFLKEADDERFLMTKVALIIGIAGACRKDELANLLLENVNDQGQVFRVQIPDTNTKTSREFFVTSGGIEGSNMVEIIRKYLKLRSGNTDHSRFFVGYRKGFCITQPVGINTFGAIPKKVASFLKLSNPDEYTGRCFRKSSTTMVGQIF